MKKRFTVNYRTKQAWIIIVLLTLFVQLVGQELPFSFFHLTNKEGLLINTVQCISQDNSGYMWFGSYQGLQRYDGYSFDSFLHDELDSTSISSNQIQSLLYTKKGELWIGTENGGLNKFDFDTETFKHYLHNPNNDNSISSNYINHIFEDASGNLWISTRRGLNKYVDSTETFMRFLYADEIQGNFISQTHAINDEYLWVATLGAGLIKFNLKTYKYEVISTKVPGTINSDIVWSVYRDSLTNKLWIGTEKGLNVLNFNTRAFEYYYYDEDELESVGRNVVRDIEPGLGNDIWLASDGGGLYQVNHEKGLFREFRASKALTNSLGADAITSLFKDRENHLWIGTVFNGIDRINLKQNPIYHITGETKLNQSGLKSNVVNAIYKDVENVFWFGTEGGLSCSKNLKTFYHYTEEVSNPTSISNNVVLTACQASDNEIWFGTYLGGISILNTRTKKFRQIINDPDANLSISSNFVRSIYKDKNGKFWIGTIRGGLDVYFPNEDRIHNYTGLINSDYVMKIISDEADNIFVATYESGVYKIDQNMKVVEHYCRNADGNKAIINDLVTTILFDSDSNLWVGTAEGLSQIDFKEHKSRHFTIQDGLTDNAINGIIEDNDHNLWITTNHGISNLERETMEFVNYNKADGFLSDEFRYNSVYKDDTGLLYFGGVEGVSYFNPKEIKPDTDSVNLTFTKLFVYNVEVRKDSIYNNQLILNKPIAKTKRIVLNNENRMFSLYFSTFDYKQHDKVEYYYVLNNSKPISLGKSHKVSFHKLPYGNYMLEVFALNTSTKQKIGHKTIEVDLKPPFYLTLFFKIVVALLFIALLVVYYFIRLNRVKKQKALLEEMVVEKTISLQETNTLLEEQQAELEMQSEELFAQKEFVEEQNKKISDQNAELDLHKKDLEKLVKKRTKELVKAKEKAERADALKTAFLANMSHEIRTPMNAILGFIDILDDDSNSPEERATFKALIHSSGDSLLSLINDIIDIAKIETAELDIFRKNFQVNKLFSNLQAIFNKKIGESNSGIHLIYKQSEEVMIFSDEHRISQVLINLLDNAVKFTEEGFIEFGYRVETKSVYFFVKDTGVGIDVEQQKNIFERFRKVENGNQKLYRGTGLGLAISKHLVELLGGNLIVESEPNVGSTFSFKLPI